MKKFHPLRIFLLAMLLGMAGGGVWLWRYVSDLTDPVLCPINKSYAAYSIVPEKPKGLKLAPFSFKGWDGGDVQAVLAVKEGDESTRQFSVMGDLAVHKAEQLGRIDYALISVDWDHGIRSALPLAESLTAAGIRCILWEPRGVGNRRPYCTHGLKECADVPLLMDAANSLLDIKDPVVVGVGQGFGAGLLLQAAAMEPRLRGLVAIDAYASLRESISRTLPDTPLSLLTLWLMDMRINSSVGFECFDVAPVERAASIDRNVPVLIINLVQDNPVVTLKDAVTIYRQLPCDTRELWTLRTAEDAPGAASRTLAWTVGKDGKKQRGKVEARLLKDEDEAVTSMVHWLNDTFVTALDTPRVLVPERPLLTPDAKL